MKIAVVYYSLSGNTKKVANAIAEELGTAAQSVKDELELEGVDLLFVGSDGYRGKPAKEIIRFLEDLEGIKEAAVFGTYAWGAGAIEFMKKILEKKGVRVIDGWGCSGALLYFLQNRGRPNEKDLEKAREFANSVLDIVMDERSRKPDGIPPLK